MTKDEILFQSIDDLVKNDIKINVIGMIKLAVIIILGTHKIDPFKVSFRVVKKHDLLKGSDNIAKDNSPEEKDHIIDDIKMSKSDIFLLIEENEIGTTTFAEIGEHSFSNLFRTIKDIADQINQKNVSLH